MRAYHHSGPKNRTGDLLGFDHAGRGYTTGMKGLPGAPTARRPLPPSPRSTRTSAKACGGSSTPSCAPTRRSGRTTSGSPTRSSCAAGELGFLGLKYEEKYGGQGGGYLHDAVWTEELARCGSGGLSARYRRAHLIATPPIWKFGTEEQKQRYLVPGIKGEKIGALGITEPDAGSDVAGLRTHAKRVDGGYVVNGSKTFITNGVRADFVVTAVKTTQEGGHHGISFLVIERGEGVTSSKLSRSSAGTPRTPPRSPSRTSSCPTRTCSARRTTAST